MPSKTLTHNFEYTKEDIMNLIKGDIARQLKMATIPIIKYNIYFNITMEEDPSDWRAEYDLTPTFKGASAKVEVPN